MIEFSNKSIMVIVAHPDDEVLGLGGLINKLKTNYDCKIHVVILGEGITSRDETRDISKRKKELKKHRSNIISAKNILGYDSLKTYNFPDNRFDSVDLINLVKVIEKEKKEFKAETIFTHHGGDLNIDHQKTFEAVITAVRPVTEELVCNVITFETMSGTEWQASSDPRNFNPNFFIELTKKEIEAKCNAMDCYEFEKRNFPHPRSSRALTLRAQMWGISNGVNFAEAFQIIRMIQKKSR